MEPKQPLIPALEEEWKRATDLHIASCGSKIGADCDCNGKLTPVEKGKCKDKPKESKTWELKIYNPVDLDLQDARIPEQADYLILQECFHPQFGTNLQGYVRFKTGLVPNKAANVLNHLGNVRAYPPLDIQTRQNRDMMVQQYRSGTYKEWGILNPLSARAQKLAKDCHQVTDYFD